MQYEDARTIVSGNRVHRPLIDETVTPEDWRKAREELGETPDTRTALLKTFKERLAGETEFVPRTDDTYLLRFLRVRKFDLERAYKLLRDHYKFRAENPKCFPAPSTIERVLRANIYTYLPHRDHMGRAIFHVKMRNWDASTIPYNDFVAAGNIVSEYVLDNPVTQINGYIGIWDFGGFSLRQFAHFCSPTNVGILQKLMQDRFPGRFKIAYCVNCPDLVNTVWKVFKIVLTEKFRNRVKFMNDDWAVLHQFVDPSILPREYGGNMPSPPFNEMAQRVIDSEAYFNCNRKFGYQGRL